MAGALRLELCVLLLLAVTAAAQRVPGLFVFGDSLIDNGNNNNLASLAKANYFPTASTSPAAPPAASATATPSSTSSVRDSCMHAASLFIELFGPSDQSVTSCGRFPLLASWLLTAKPCMPNLSEMK
jgi:hypothetical protein